MKNQSSRAFGLALFIILSVLSVACSESRETRTESSLLRGYRLIDAQRTDEAIAFFEALQEENPDDIDLQVALASAYAHKAGVRVQTLAPMISRVKGLDKLGEVVQEPAKEASPEAGAGPETAAGAGAEAGEQMPQKVDVGIKGMVLLLADIGKVSNLYTAIPVIEDKNLVYLDRAIAILNHLDEPRPSDALYRAILKIVHFKHGVASKLIGRGQQMDISMGECRIDLLKVSDTLVYLGRNVISILNDISIAQPNQAEDLERVKKTVADNVSNLTSSISSLMIMDETSMLLMQRSVLTHGFGNLLQCSKGP